MEANTKQQQLTYEKGVTNLPSDAICSDNALQTERNLIFRDGEHHVIQTPAFKQQSSYNLLFVHKTAEGDNYIYDSGSKLYNGPTDISGISGSDHSSPISPQHVTAIGNTLILAYGGDIHRFLYQNGSYTNLSHIPEPQVAFYLDEPSFGLGYYYLSNRQSSEDIISEENRIVPGSQEKYNNMVTGLYALNKKEIAQIGGFCEPFMACIAIELYDGSYTLITNPVLLFPSISMNSYAENENHIFRLRTRFSKLYCSQLQDYSAYSAIVKDVVLFVTDGIPIYDVSADQHFNEYAEGDNTTDGIVYHNSRSQLVFTTIRSSSLTQQTQWDVLVKQRESDIVNALEGTAVFYRLCSLGVNPTGTINIATKIDKHTLENLTSQPQLTSLDYYSRSPLSATFLYAYNNRLLISGVTRGFFEGFDFFLPYDAEDNSSYTFYVTIQTPSGQRVVSHTKSTKQYQGTFFYYPDPRASHVVIMKGQSCVLDANLKEHPFLNGAYYLRGLPGIVPETIVSGSAPATNNTPEPLENYILSSEVNNPFLFPAAGYTRIGNGRILGMAALTQALSQGQFGQYPLLAFTTEGIWAVSIDATGRFAATHPMSREVALEDNPAITPVDGAVFFLSEKGLMVVSGNQVRCVSQQLSGKFTGHNFQDFFATCIIAYDYRDSLLWLFNSQSTEQCLVYSIASATFAYANLNGVQRAVPNYPDYLIQSGTDIYSFLSRPNPNSDNNPYSATIITRPLKLENALALKTITQLRHIGQFNAGQASVLTLRIFASNNLNNLNDWTELHSLRGRPWKYYQFQYDFTNLKATDTFAGSVIITQERRTDKLR